MVKLGSGISVSLPMADPGFSREKLTAATSFEDTVHLPLVVMQMILNIIAILWNPVNVHESTKRQEYVAFLNCHPKQSSETQVSSVTSKCENDECKKVEPHSGDQP